MPDEQPSRKISPRTTGARQILPSADALTAGVGIIALGFGADALKNRLTGGFWSDSEPLSNGEFWAISLPVNEM